jgi:glycosyltransferase involved in cell wall biosynthesis
VLEAIAAGRPVITANQTPFTEFLTPTQALLVDPNLPTAIAQAMQTVLQPDLAQRLVQQSQSVISQYNWETAAQMHLHHYQTLTHYA